MHKCIYTPIKEAFQTVCTGRTIIMKIALLLFSHGQHKQYQKRHTKMLQAWGQLFMQHVKNILLMLMWRFYIIKQMGATVYSDLVIKQVK